MNDFMIFDTSALVLLAALICASLSTRKFKGTTNGYYFVVLLVSSLIVLFRLAFQIILRIYPYSESTVAFASVFVYLYFMIHSTLYPFVIFYVFSAIGVLRIVKKTWTIKAIMIALVDIPLLYILIDCFLHTIFRITPSMEVEFLFPARIFSFCYISLLSYSFIVVLYFRKSIEKSQIYHALVLIPVNIFFYIIQSLVPNASVEMFAVATSCYILYATVQRPELLFNSQVNARSLSAFEKELHKAVNTKFPATIILIKIMNYHNINVYIGTDRFNDFLKEVSKYLTDFHKKEKLNGGVFYLDDYLYAIPTEDKTEEELEIVLNKLEEYFGQVFEISGIHIELDTRTFVIRYPEDISDYDYLIFISKLFHKLIPATSKSQWYRDFINNQTFKIKTNMESILERAIVEKHFDVYYQPIFGVKENRFVSAEALIRLNDPEFGFIEPDLFLEYAESTNQIHIIGDFVIENVCKFIGSEEFTKLGLEYIEINLSIAQCLESDLLGKIISWLEKYNVNPGQLKLEITESTVSFNPISVERSIYTLQHMGIDFALDDYGTGYSNIKKVLSLPFSLVKLNKAFVDEMNRPESVSLIEDTVHLFNSLKKKVLVEGIESEEMAEYFKKLKVNNENACEYLQGFYFSKPLPKSEFVKFLTI